MPIIQCKNCGKEAKVRSGQQFCAKPCSVSYRQKIHDPNFLGNSDFDYYLLGLVAADGCVSHQAGKVERLTVSLKDKEFMEELRKVMTPERKLYENKKQGYNSWYNVITTNEEVILWFKDNGIETRKTFTLKYPNVPKEQVRHFVRGFFDGDGSIFKNANKQYGDYYHISFTTASEEFARGLAKQLEDEGFTPKIVKDSRSSNGSVYVKLYRQDEIKRFADWIYQDAEWYLDRKKQTFMMI